MNISYWGTRGSVPTLNKQTHKYGGNTPCVAISDENILLILDAGSGIRGLGDSISMDMIDHYEIHILITHFHLDHIQGLGFFKPLFIKGKKITIWGPQMVDSTLRSNVGKYFGPPLFPVHLRELPCDLTLSEVRPKRAFQIGSYNVVADFICHPGPTLGYRILKGDRTVTYLPDHEPWLGSVDFPNNREWTSGYDLAQGADLLIHDSHFSSEDYESKIGWGHCSIQQAIDFARLAGVRRLDLFHHNPEHTDERLEELYVRRVDGTLPFDVSLSREGTNLTV